MFCLSFRLEESGAMWSWCRFGRDHSHSQTSRANHTPAQLKWLWKTHFHRAALPSGLLRLNVTKKGDFKIFKLKNDDIIVFPVQMDGSAEPFTQGLWAGLIHSQKRVSGMLWTECLLPLKVHLLIRLPYPSAMVLRSGGLWKVIISRWWHEAGTLINGIVCCCSVAESCPTLLWPYGL